MRTSDPSERQSVPDREKLVTREWSHPPEQVFTALVHAVEGGKYRLEVRNDSARQLFFEKGSKWGWLHQFAAEVVSSDGTSRLEVTVTSPPEAIIGLANGFILHRAGQRVTKAVDAELSATPGA